VRRRIRTAAAIALALVLLGAGGLFAAACASSPPDDIGLAADGRLRPCPSSPNCVCSQDPQDGAPLDALAFEGDPAEAWSSLLAHVQGLPRTELVTATERYAHAVFRTALFRFADDVELSLAPAERVIHVRSASRLGWSDFGANRRRVEGLRASWAASRGSTRP
jgi:uncharacterized protein (DUF1499 family)